MTAVPAPQNPQQQTALALPASPALEPTAKGLETAKRVVTRMLPPSVSYVRDLPANALVPAEKCRAILTALEPVQPPAQGDAEHAAVVADCMLRLLGAFPVRKIADQAAYREGFEKLLWEYPALVCRQAIDQLTRTSTYLPNRAELSNALNEANEILLKLRRLAKAHLEDGERRAKRAALPRMTDADRAANKDRVSAIVAKFLNREKEAPAPAPASETHATPPRARDAGEGSAAHA